MPDSPSTSDVPGIIDTVLKKYVRVWLWSILVGTGTWLLFTSALSLGGSGRSSLLGAVLGAGSLIAAALSWLDLFGGFRAYLLPEFVLEGSTLTQDALVSFGGHLRRAFLSLIVAVLTRALIPLADSLWLSLVKF